MRIGLLIQSQYSFWIGDVILRVSQLTAGLLLYGVGCAVMIAAGIGLDPWTVLAQGLAERTGIGIGWMTNIIGFAVLLLWLPLRQRPGIGTVLNILLVGTAIQFVLPYLPTPDQFWLGIVMFLAGIAIVGLASGVYIATDLGPGPRDGLMTGLSARFGWPIWVSRTTVEVIVLVTGWLLGGTIGLGTILFALLIGPACHASLRVFRRARSRSSRDGERVADTSDPSIAIG